MITNDELRTLFLFEKLDEDKLSKISAMAKEVAYPAQTTIVQEGEPATCFVILLSGTFSMLRAVRGGADIETNRTDQRGAYGGAISALLNDEAAAYWQTLRAFTDCTVLELPAMEFGSIVREWFPMAIHLLAGVSEGGRRSQAKVAEQERLVALGSVTAGLTHELNNPAAAVSRASAGLAEHIAGLRKKLGSLADGSITREKLSNLVQLQEEIAQAPPTHLSPLEVSDREDELGDWLEEREVPKAYDIAPAFVAKGLGVEWVKGIEDRIGAGSLPAAMHWLFHTAEAEALLADIDDASRRISGLLARAKQYSQMDRAPLQHVDVHDLLDSTLALMRHKMGPHVHVVTDYDRSLPEIDVWAAELNQVWTNLMDNAIDAMDGQGTLTLRTARDGAQLQVEIGDSGPGIPEEVRSRIFEPFFSTKQVGKGTGLGLDISRRIVVERHGGALSVKSRPGDTRFQVRLPLNPPAAA
jgi:signal transduction histidine kinase